MANKVIQLTSTVKPVTGLEVYRDISMKADLNQANIFRSYKEVKPIIELSGGHMTDESYANLDDSDLSDEALAEISDYMIQGEISAIDFIKLGFNIKAQISDTYYIEDFGQDFEDFSQYLGAELSGVQPDPDAAGKGIRLESYPTTKILMLSNDGQVSALANWRESKMWNPYKLAKLVNVQAVFNSLHNIFTWTPGERILNPEFGNKLKTYLYEGITEFTAESIIAEIRRCISEYEPRVHVVSINNVSTPNDTENNTIQIDIVFTIPSLSREQFIYSYTYKYHNDNE